MKKQMKAKPSQSKKCRLHPRRNAVNLREVDLCHECLLQAIKTANMGGA